MTITNNGITKSEYIAAIRAYDLLRIYSSQDANAWQQVADRLASTARHCAPGQREWHGQLTGFAIAAAGQAR